MKKFTLQSNQQRCNKQSNIKITHSQYLVFLFFLLFLIFAFLSSNRLSNKAMAAKSIQFTKTYQSLAIHTKVQYRIKNMKKTDFVRFTINNHTLASIHPKTGWITPKKQGLLTIKAFVYNKKRKKLKTLITTVRIIKNKTYLPNATFQVKDSINPWNFTLTLSCSRILLKKEIEKDTLILYPKGTTSPKLTASFTSLSTNGKEATYTLSSTSQKRLCPGDSSMNGNYILKSSCFSEKLVLNYQERLTNYTLSGFVSKTNGNPIKNALVSLKKGNLTKETCYTDQNGHYSLSVNSSPDLMTVEKSGFQKKKISFPALSKIGTTCENITLRSTSENHVAICFLITDLENNPLPNANIAIFPAKNSMTITDKESKEYILNKDILNNSISNKDSYNSKELLYSGKTDSSGTLLLSNSSIATPSPCSNLTLKQKASITYSASSDLSSTNAQLLSSSILNQNDNYYIYVSKFALDAPCSGYHPQKLFFSFSPLLTNHAFIHIQLSACQKTQINHLTLKFPKNTFSSCQTLSLQFFHPDKKESFYQYTIRKEQLSIQPDKISFSRQLPLTLPDGKYFLSIHAISGEEVILAKSPIIPVSIEKATIPSGIVALQLPHYARFLAYGSFSSPDQSTASFSLYQKCESHYFYIDTFTTTFFQSNNTEYNTANLLPELLSGQNYLLQPCSDIITSNDSISFLATEDNIYLIKEHAEFSSTPLGKIHCITSNGSANLKSQAESVTDKITYSYLTFHNLSEDFIRSSLTYPNCVIAMYQTDGTFITATQTSPPVSGSTSYSPDYKAYLPKIITDIYINKEILITNQDSYH